MVKAADLFRQAYVAYHSQDLHTSIDLYVKCINQILKSESLRQPIPAIFPTNNVPQELIAIAFHELTSFFRGGEVNPESAPDAYKLLTGFKPNSDRAHSRFKTDAEKLILKAIQINVGLTLGLIAWDKKDRATAAKRYQETIDFARTQTKWNEVDYNSTGLNRWAADNVKQVKDNLETIIQNDTINARLAQAYGEDGGNLRKSNITLPNTRIETDGVTFNDTILMATDACGHCGKRELKLLRCSNCKKIAYCDRACQKGDWRTHKAACRSSA